MTLSKARRFAGAATVPALAAALAAAITLSSSGHPLYRVRAGDTLSAIAAHHHTTVERLVRLNHLPAGGNLIYAGALLRLPGARTVGHAPPRRAGAWSARYVARPGDTLSGIAARYGVSWTTLARHNHITGSVVVIGQRLRVPAGGGAPARRTIARWRLHVPSRATVAALIRSTAQRWHVDPALALGIAYEESGFNQAAVSSVHAVGAMQVLPATGRWLSAYVVHRRLHLRRAADNVTAGVAFLSVLLRATGGQERRAVAGYYQGLASVRERGMFSDTRRYVANVLALRNRF